MNKPKDRACAYPGCGNMVTSMYGKYCSDDCRSKGMLDKAHTRRYELHPTQEKPLTEQEKKLKTLVGMFPKPHGAPKDKDSDTDSNE